MLPAVVIEVPSDWTLEATATVVERCQRALGSERCLQPSDSASLVARYSAALIPDGSGLKRVRIELHAAATSGQLLAERTLAFTDLDAIESRWASLGLVVAGLVAARDVPEPQPRPLEKPRQLPKAQDPPRRPSGDAWGVDLGGIVGQGFTSGPYRFGGLIRGWHRLDAVPQVLLLSSVRFATRAPEPLTQWASLGVGLGTRWGNRDAIFNPELTGEVVGERLGVSSALGGASDSDSQWRFGGRIGVAMSLFVQRSVRLVVGVDATVLTPSVKIELQSRVVAREPSARLALTLTLRVAP